jgi:multicomponent Na+:H+ antiporter subunit D
MDHWLPLAAVVPLAAAALAPALGRGRPALAWGLAVAAAAWSLLAAAVLTRRLVLAGPFSYAMGGWPPPYGIELRFDALSAASVFIALVYLLVLVYSRRDAEVAIPAHRRPWYYSLLLLNLGGLVGFVCAGDLFNLFVFMELASVSSYALVAAGGGRIAALAALKYLLAGAVSSVLILFSIGVLHALTGSLNMADVAARLAGSGEGAPAALALGGLTAGFMVKAALFPLHLWLPDAHASAPSPVSAVLSGLVVNIGIIGWLRILPLFAGVESVALGVVYETLAWLGAAAIIAGALAALFQQDIKLMLAYSTVSNIGYIVLGLGLANPVAATGATVHVLNHALIKSTLFLAAGALIHQTGFRTLHDLRGVGRVMPWTGLALSIGVLAIVGLPPTAGFLGKWYIALGALEAGRPGFAVALLAGALLIFFYYVRILNAFYFRAPVQERMLAVREAPLSMLLPVLLLAALCVLGGLFGRWPIDLLAPLVQQLPGGG